MLEPERLSEQTIIIETPRGAFVKRNEEGGVDYISPFPSPFHYGRLENFAGGDGDPMDAIWFGTRSSTDRIDGVVIGVVRFVDKGEVDDKWILSDGRSLTTGEVIGLKSFFAGYAALKNGLELFRNRAMNSTLLGIELFHNLR